MLNEVLLRPTFIVGDMDKAVAFYTRVFGWTVIFDQVIKVDRRFPPAAPDRARCRLTVFQIEDPEVGGLGFMQYLDDEIPAGPSKHRGRLGQGEAILVVRSADPDACHDRIRQTDAVVISPPTDWEVVGAEPGQVIGLRTMSLFDPNGIYIEVNQRHPDSKWPANPAT
ncbi:MAG: VOC family protein [Sandarakinorhabdus sp.]|nr:VOC family protein [Sandarakinorhabdus sp.]